VTRIKDTLHEDLCAFITTAQQHIECTVIFPQQELLHNRTKMLCYMYTAYLVLFIFQYRLYHQIC